MLAADHGGRRVVAIVAGAEPPKADDLVDDQPGRNVAARDDQDPRLAIARRTPGAEKRLQVDDREQLPPQVRDSTQPRLGARYARDVLRDRQHLANVAAAADETLRAEPETDANPLVRLGRRPLARRDRGACPPFQLLQQLERPFGEGLE